MSEETRLDVGDDIIICRDVEKWFDDFHVLRGITITMKKGEVIVICGHSGSGKSTFIRTINRLENDYAICTGNQAIQNRRIFFI